MNVEPYDKAHGEMVIHVGAGEANRLLLALERLDQMGGLDPELARLRDAVRSGLVTKSSGDTDSAPSTE